MLPCNFITKFGVPKGSLCGPKFLGCIMNDILHSLESEHLVCFVNNSYLGAIAYADNIITFVIILNHVAENDRCLL